MQNHDKTIKMNGGEETLFAWLFCNFTLSLRAWHTVIIASRHYLLFFKSFEWRSCLARRAVLITVMCVNYSRLVICLGLLEAVMFTFKIPSWSPLRDLRGWGYWITPQSGIISVYNVLSHYLRQRNLMKQLIPYSMYWEPMKCIQFHCHFS